jgi:glucan biosynthesis protein C
MRSGQQVIESRGGAVAVRTRTAWVDNLRVALIAGVIVAHAATAYIVDVSWYYEERTTSTLTPLVLSFPIFVAAVFGLGPLFLVAGAFSARSLQHKGPAAFARGRLVRLGVPLVVFVLALDPITDYLGDLGSPAHQNLWAYLTDRTGTRDLGPMWFVAALLLFCLAYAAWRWRHPRVVVSGETVETWRLALFAGSVAVVSWLTWMAVTYRSVTFFNFNWAHWPQAGGLFVLGVMAGERGWLETFTTTRARRCGWIALTGVLILCGLAGMSLAGDDFASLVGGPHWQSAAFAFVTGVVAVTLGMWITAWFERRWDHAGPVARHAGRGSYAAYVVHPTVLVALSLAVMALAVAPEAKFVIVAAIGVPLTFMVGYGLTQVNRCARHAASGWPSLGSAKARQTASGSPVSSN